MIRCTNVSKVINLITIHSVLISSTALTHRFHPICGKQVTLADHVTASRAPNSFSHGLVFSAEPLQSDEVFEVRVQKVHPHFAGSLRIGLTNLNVNGTHVSMKIRLGPSSSRLPDTRPQVAKATVPIDLQD